MRRGSDIGNSDRSLDEPRNVREANEEEEEEERPQRREFRGEAPFVREFEHGEETIARYEELLPSRDERSDFYDEHVYQKYNGDMFTWEQFIADCGDTVRSYISMDRRGFTKLGEHVGIRFERHEEMTSKGNGASFYRVKAKVRLPPEYYLALLLDAEQQARVDPSIKHVYQFHEFPDGRTFLEHTLVKTPFFGVLYDRDMVNMVTWKRDENGVFWYFSATVSGPVPHFPGRCIPAETHYWGYRLIPIHKGDKRYHTDVVGICQVSLKGALEMLPGSVGMFFNNWAVGKSIADYIRKMEQNGRNLREAMGSGFMKAYVKSHRII